MVALAEQGLHPNDRGSGLTGFDVFVLVLSVLSLANIVLVVLTRDPDIVNVVLVIDGVICLVLLADFLLRLHRAPSKGHYLAHERGWLDLLGSLPVPGLRLARLFRVVRVAREIHRYGPRGIAHSADADRAGSSLLVAMFLTIVVLQYGSMAILYTEEDAAGANIHTASDALWWSYVTITTVGYGDRFPVTNDGRTIGVGILTVGVALFGVLSGYLAKLFLAPRRARGLAPASHGHDPSLRAELDELRGLIAELRAQATGATGAAASVVDASAPPVDPGVGRYREVRP